MIKHIRRLGPAIILASIVLGPGSILASSKVGCQYGYEFLWVTLTATLLMIGLTAVGALIGITVAGTPCGEVAGRFGRAAAVAVGVTLFLIVALFQASNNIAVLASLESFLGMTGGARSPVVDVVVLGGLNALIVAVLFGFRETYRPLEKLMSVMVIAMFAGFTVNLLLAKPSLSGMIAGLTPGFPAGQETPRFLPFLRDGVLTDDLWAVQALVATTLSVAAAFFQPYLVREKNWSTGQARIALTDTAVGIAILGVISGIVMATSAAALHGKVDPDALRSAGDVAEQLRPLFGDQATLVLSLGILAAAFSSFLGNALVGGVVLSDSLGLGSSLGGRWPRLLTVAALGLGFLGAAASTLTSLSVVQLVVVAQALTVLGVPLLSVVMLWLAGRIASPAKPLLIGLTALATLVVCALAVRTAWRIVLTLA
ncbi:Divalent metal cation transporter MntH [Posidoniimonas corsicana]|uniref:Divalent metal cation transporter MntH n=1 Tax=Posidoniimonas corsicana TaxID=1938618 RepID=A0A5C5VEW6_9BACT|nr:divalent metal cation transporter [Posidoniimonas corsicana]TWT36467.1 Divalent metal cation transporter MntH [Posidoniimonas corsicana]